MEDDITVHCDCGERNMFPVFEVIVIAAVIMFFLYITASVVSHCKCLYLKRNQCTEQMKIQKEKSFREKFQNELLFEEVSVAKAVFLRFLQSED